MKGFGSYVKERSRARNTDDIVLKTSTTASRRMLSPEIASTVIQGTWTILDIDHEDHG